MMLTTLARRFLCVSVALACAFGGSGSVWAAGLSVSPVVIEIDSPRKAVAITVTNNSDRNATFQAEAMTWQQDNGADHYEPTDDLLVVPPIVEVPARASQIFRVMLRVPTQSPVERTYRVMLEDISEEVSLSERTGVAFKFVHNLPVMVAPAGKVTNAMQWKPCASARPASASKELKQAAGAEACVRLRNTGNRRIKVSSLMLTGDNWQQALTLKDAVNVLVGAEREWRVPLLPSQPGKPHSVQVQTAQGEMLQAAPGEF